MENFNQMCEKIMFIYYFTVFLVDANVRQYVVMKYGKHYYTCTIVKQILNKVFQIIVYLLDNRVVNNRIIRGKVFVLFETSFQVQCSGQIVAYR